MITRKLLTVDQLFKICEDMVSNGCGHFLVGFYVMNENSLVEELDWTPIKHHDIDIAENTLDFFS
jgi:hypothetical protein